MTETAWHKLTHNLTADTHVVAGGDLQTSSSDILGQQTFEALIRGNYLFISYFAKPNAGTMTPKFRIWTYHSLMDKWGKSQLIIGQTVSDTTNGETIDLEPILVGPGKVALLLEDCETGGELIVEVERAGPLV